MRAERIAMPITVAELARERRMHPSTVRRWLLDLDAKHGGSVVFRRGTGRNAKLYTTMAALGRVAPEYIDPDRDLRAKLGEVQSEMAILTDRVDTLTAQLRDFEAKMCLLKR